MDKIWMSSGNTYSQVNPDYRMEESLPKGIYNVCLTRQGFFLEKFADQFVFPYKVYGLQKDFVEHVLGTYKKTSGNLGVMLTGTKGTGKTVTAKELANQLQLPVIIVKNMEDDNQAMIEFLSGIESECVFFLDEFEKNFKDTDSTILQLMDGVYNSEYRKIFLLTTNSLSVNDNLIGRPSRIRYLKEFGNLELSIVNEYLDDELLIPEARQEIIDYIDALVISTIDILKTLVEEVNIHGIEGFHRIKKFFNVISEEYLYSCISAKVPIYKAQNAPGAFSIKEFCKVADDFKNSALEYVETENFGLVTRSTIFSEIKFSSLQVGDYFGSDEIIAIERDLGIIITQCGDYLYYTYINNKDAKPSLYGKKSNLVL